MNDLIHITALVLVRYLSVQLPVVSLDWWENI